MVGENDSGTPVSAAEYIHKKITSSALTIIPDAAHFVHMEQSSLFNHAFLEFIKVNAGH
jgi:pimeloyl-ACP methyl ester carboxylesterase